MSSSLGSADFKSMVHKSADLRNISLTGRFHKVNSDWDLWSLRRNHITSAISISDGKPGSRISRSVRADAQNALFDYLHCTRCLSFTDAEHISKNSPVFLQSLVAKVKQRDEVGRAVSKFLLFNPINEFEPFLESLGLKTSELYPLLPHGLMFLSEDDGLVENYLTLCHYGVPRSKIGKMYKEGNDIFRYDSGVLNSKLQCYEKLGLSKPTIIKLVTCCPSLLIGDPNSDFLTVLRKLKALGVDLDLIRGCFSDKSVYRWDRILKKLYFLDGMDWNKKDLAEFINEHPRFVFDDSGRKIYILVALLLKLGFTKIDVLALFVEHPRILVGMFVKRLWRSIAFLVEVGMDIKHIRKIVKEHPHVLGASSRRGHSFFMRNLKLLEDRLCDIIREDPTQFAVLVSTKNSGLVAMPNVQGSFLREKTEFLLRIGFLENSDEMIRALSKFQGRGDRLQDRFDFLVGIGLDCHTVTEMIKSIPAMLNQSIDVLEKKANFFLNDLGYPVKELAAFPSYLCYNFDRIKLRLSMIRWLMQRGVSFSTRNRKVPRPSVALSTVLACSDARFFKRFVNMHPEGPEEWDRLKRSFSSK